MVRNEWLWILAALAGLVFLLYIQHETFVDKESPVTRPEVTSSVWKSKVDAETPIGANDDDYIRTLQLFYDTKYSPASITTKPSITDVDNFIKSASIPAGIDTAILKKLIKNGFRIESGMTAAAREKSQIVKEQTAEQIAKDIELLNPDKGVDQVRTRTEEIYVPADTEKGMLPEGKYAPVEQQDTPRHSGERDYKSTSWTNARFFDVCESGDKACMENVL
jgi:hypothetical protein